MRQTTFLLIALMACTAIAADNVPTTTENTTTPPSVVTTAVTPTPLGLTLGTLNNKQVATILAGKTRPITDKDNEPMMMGTLTGAGKETWYQNRTLPIHGMDEFVVVFDSSNILVATGLLIDNDKRKWIEGVIAAKYGKPVLTDDGEGNDYKVFNAGDLMVTTQKADKGKIFVSYRIKAAHEELERQRVGRVALIKTML